MEQQYKTELNEYSTNGWAEIIAGYAFKN